MQTAERGELLRFGTVVDGVALLVSSDARPAPRSATLTVRRDLFSVEALFTHADGSFWRRHFTARFLPDGVDVSIGVVAVPMDTRDFDPLIDQADREMYRRKRALAS